MLNNTTFSSEIRNTLLLIAWKPLCEKCPNAEFFLVRIFPYSVEYWKSPYSVWIPEITDEKKFRISTLFTHENISLMGDFNTPSENAKWYGLINPLSGNPTKWPNTLKQIAWVCLATLLIWRLKASKDQLTLESNIRSKCFKSPTCIDHIWDKIFKNGSSKIFFSLSSTNFT